MKLKVLQELAMILKEIELSEDTELILNNKIQEIVDSIKV